MSARDVQSSVCEFSPVKTGANAPAVPALCPDPSSGAAAGPARSAPIIDNGENGGRDPHGRFTRGNAAALVHGAYSDIRLSRARPAIDDLVAAIRADKGGDVSALTGDLIFDYARASVLAESIFENLARAGSATGRVIERWLQIVDRKIRLAEKIGTARDAKPTSIEDLPELTR
jgi:hypothetical protein